MATQKLTKTFGLKTTKILITLLLLAFSTNVFSKTTTVGDGLFVKTYVVGTSTTINGDLVVGKKGANILLNAKVIVKGNLILKGHLDINAGGKLEVHGNIEIKGDKEFIVRSGAEATIIGNLTALDNADIKPNGKLEVGGDFTAGNNADIDMGINGKLAVGGNFTTGNKATIHTLTDSKITIGGDLSMKDATLTAGGSTQINVGGGFTVENNVDLNIGTNGGVSVGKEFKVGGVANVDMLVSGKLAVGENFTTGNGSSIHSLDNAEISVGGNLDMKNNAYLTIGTRAELDVGNSLTIGDDARVYVRADAKVSIDGSFKAGNGSKLDLNVNTETTVVGDFNLGNNSNLDINSGGEFVVIGDLSTGNDTRLLLRRGSKSTVVGDFVAGSGVSVNNDKLTDDENPPLYVLGSVDKSKINIGRVNVYGYNEILNEEQRFKDKINPHLVNPLPITLINFCAETFSNYNHLQWATASESNNDYFTIYKSTDGVNWEWLAEEASANGNSSTRTNYEFIDNNVEYGITYYKLEQTDFDGTTETSKVISVESNVEKADFVISKEGITVTFANPDETETVVITSVQGRVLYKKSFTGVYDAFIETGNLTKSVYIVSLYSSVKIKSQKFVK